MKKTGFTLVEILIVVIILGILAAIVVPQFTNASNDGKISRVAQDVQTVRQQIELYKIHHNDRDPATDATANGVDFWTQLTSRSDEDGTINAAGEFGPYLPREPMNPFVLDAANAPSSDVFLGALGGEAATDGWCYDAAGTGVFYALGADPDGNALSDF